VTEAKVKVPGQKPQNSAWMQASVYICQARSLLVRIVKIKLECHSLPLYSYRESHNHATLMSPMRHTFRITSLQLCCTQVTMTHSLVKNISMVV